MNKENFVITIGDFGSIVMLHSGNKIKKSFYAKTLDETELAGLETIFRQSEAPITILLDNLDQTYKKKTYPLVGLNSLKNIAKREMASDGDKTSFKNYIPYVPKKSSRDKRSECLYISASKSELIDKWLEITNELPNRITGIHVVPVESFQLLKLLTEKSNTNVKKTLLKKKRDDLCCLILQTKVGGVRQLVFCDRGIIFTRIVNYDFTQDDWLEHYEQDLYSTFEYLKRSFPTIKIQDLNFYNIFHQDILDKISTIGNDDLHFTNYTPRQAGRKCGLNNMISSKEEFCDILLSKIFFLKKRLLKFTTPLIQKCEYLFYLIWGSYVLNGLAVLSFIIALISIGLYRSETTYIIERSKKNREIASNELKNTQIFEEQEGVSARNFGALNVERIIDFGQVDEKLNQDSEQDFLEFYSQLAFIKRYDSKLSSFRYFLEEFDYKRPNNKAKHIVKIEGKMNNKTGDIDDLFKNFDNVSSAAVGAFKNYKVDYQEIPRTINFTKKYYDYPINFTISNSTK